MAPIKVGILGLSTKPSAWATLAHYPYLKTSEYYKIVAVCNSSLQSSQAAIDHFNLTGAKAHDSWESLAQDPDVDLIVVSTRADTHYDVAKPALLAGKSVFVEWPLGANASQAKEMSELAERNGCRTIVGLQGRVAPSVLTVKQVVDSGRLGEIHSVSYQGTTNVWQDNAAGERYHYFMDRKVGGNLLTIYGGHIIDSITCAVGDLESWQTLAGNFRKTMKVKRADGTLSEEKWQKDTPDQMMLVGRLKRDPPAMFNFHLRAGDKFAGQPGSVWRVYGTKAELQMTFKSAGPQIGVAESMKICDFGQGTVEDVTIDEGGERWTSLPDQGQNIGRLYEAFATGKAGVDYADWEHAVRRHEMIDGFYNTMV
ncbi:transcription regulator gal80 [Exophiala xenobiotica]|uniref:Transcription regulator gal80 n=1 Tax=Lithohypha guttulata TaxID=1690604 RepID=A0ABR0KL49_9EURO|nr:transcription regulator gal80 [Lithohypha guttulata]KAK5326041.1 transcription regulator gal80 [Exophiala xenobiotica]